MTRAALLKLGVAVATVVVFGYPAVAMLVSGASYGLISAESMAYRFFFVARLADGEGGGVWLPQGQLMSLLERLLYPFVVALRPDDVFSQIELLGSAFSFAVVLIVAGAMSIPVLRSDFTPGETVIVGGATVAGISLFQIGVYYSTQPDYTSLNTALYAFALVLFLHYAKTSGRPLTLGRGIWAGAFAGLLASNKVSMPPIAVLAVAPLVLVALARGNNREVARFATVYAAAAILTFALIFLALYDFRPAVAWDAFGDVVDFAISPGGRQIPTFADFVEQSWGLRYWLSFAVLAAALTALALSERFAFLTSCLVCAAIYAWFIYHHPSGSTFFESSLAFVVIAAMALSSLPATPVMLLVTGAITAGWLVAAYQYFPYELVANYRGTKPESEARSGIMRDAIAAGRPIVAVIPTNEWAAAGGPLVLLLKGLSDFPTWQIPPARRMPLAVPISFRTEQGGAKPGEPYSPGSTILWEDLPDRPALSETYPALRAAAEERACSSVAVRSRLWICVPRDGG